MPKEPRERGRYVVRVARPAVADAPASVSLVEVDRETYLVYYRALRRERYAAERDRRQGVVGFADLSPWADGPEGFADGAWEAARDSARREVAAAELRRAAADLPRAELEAVCLRFGGGGLSERKVAGRMGVSRHTARKLIDRALRRLRERVLAALDEYDAGAAFP